MGADDVRGLATAHDIGAGRVVLLPGMALIDLKAASNAPALFEALDRCRDVLSERAPSSTQLWVPSEACLKALDDKQFAQVTQRLYDCFAASPFQFVLFERADPDPAVVYLLGSLGMHLLPPKASIDVIAPGRGAARVEVLPFLDAFTGGGRGGGDRGSGSGRLLMTLALFGVVLLGAIVCTPPRRTFQEEFPSDAGRLANAVNGPTPVPVDAGPPASAAVVISGELETTAGYGTHYAPVGGQVKRVLVRRGDSVERGQVLAIIENKEVAAARAATSRSAEQEELARLQGSGALVEVFSVEAGEIKAVNARAGHQAPNTKPLFEVSHWPRLVLVGLLPKADARARALQRGAEAVVSIPRLTDGASITGRIEGVREQQEWLRVVIRLDRTVGLRVGDVGTAEIAIAPSVAAP